MSGARPMCPADTSRVQGEPSKEELFSYPALVNTFRLLPTAALSSSRK